MLFRSDDEFAVSEFWDVEGLVFGIRCFSFLLLIVVCGGAVGVRCAHIHEAVVFTGAAPICGHTTSPALAVAGR